MKILRIGGKNLASLAGEFGVDFESEPLASSGLFAISGPTGAGKSTLLDALCLALYDATPRLIKGPRAGNVLPDVGDETLSVLDRRTLLRRGTADAYAEVDFIGNDEARYRARWSVRRSRNRPGGALQPVTMSLQRLPNLEPIGATKTEVLGEIERRIGLSFEQFTRSVLLAQNEFSAFLRTDENERGELLETLTGSAVYSEISRRAFERWREEQEAMRRLTSRLQDQTPLSPDERALLDEEHARAQAALNELEARRAALEQQLRWHRELDVLARDEAQVEAALLEAKNAVDAAQDRRRRLATLDAIQPARALVADLQRLADEQRQAQSQLATGERDLERAANAQRQATQGHIEADRKLEAAELLLRDQTPLLDRAKALDALLSALLPTHTQAAGKRDAAQRDSTQAEQALQAKAAQLDAAQKNLQDTQAWLAGRADLEGLAAQWERWEQRLEQAELAARTAGSAAAAFEQARAGLEQAANGAQRTAAQLEGATSLLGEREAARARAQALLDGVDADALRDERAQLEARREALGSFDTAWRALQAGRAQLAKLDAQAGDAERSRAAAQSALEAARSAGIAIDATLSQAERLFEGAQLACADGVENLRAELASGEPCPVCGSEDHPYRHQDARLHSLLEKLGNEVVQRRQEQRANLNEQAQQRAAADAGERQLIVLAGERTALLASIGELEREADANPLAPEAPALEAGEWVASQQAGLRARLEALAGREQALRQALLARDSAQQALDAAQRDHARLLQAAQQAQVQLGNLETELAALQARRDAAAGVLADVVAELDPVLAQACGHGWQLQWQKDPAGWRQARVLEARGFAERSSRLAGLQATIGTLAAEHAASIARREQAGKQLGEAHAEFERIDAELAERRRERAALFDGRPARDVEQQLNAGIAAAREAVNACQAAILQAAQLEASVRAAQARAMSRIGELQQASQDAAARLAQWIEDFASRAPEMEPVDSEQQLATLLAVGSAWIAQERASLAALDAKVGQCGAVLAERRARRQKHLEARPVPAAAGMDDTVQPDAEAVARALLEAEDARRSAHEAAASLAMRIREDEQRRDKARSMMAEIERQRAIEERWAKLSELIGSADGKKFRNYAQQFTLDVLLGYANIHLAQLARRYRLERVASNAGPSLSLMVRDQDMGGEIRSVNSLSGGESFLVSLALALGLASLSSNRVKVESLFIDEGFGSLDSDTLGVAMDALDALQSLGRKVGVISHVQEMTERIGTKVLVRPAGGGSSAVTVQ